ncbi:MAG TPA: pyridoxamine 5'-phosphate oxidase family protein [Mycobacteriales bacterium]|nr:pyridoxamine 5'-phosphate oxidase family protein [Mycobacteriales bacterium]
MNSTERMTGEAVVREMSRAECLEALRSQRLGRIAISQNALPSILPVNYAMDVANIVFRTSAGSALARACNKTIVAFEIDRYEPATGTGWSVVVVGAADALSGGDWLRAVELGLPSAAAADGEVFIRITPGMITGRVVGSMPVVYEI